ncbi:MAG: hypothetical protein KDC91_09505, partial [Flavobacteriaceae bacterium]|nr:hypothetical protein [Flavobacteriaceae bacterium]
QEIFPDEFDVQYRLALGLCYQCQYKFKGCEEGNSLIDKLLLTYPNKTELDSIKKIFNHWGLQ